MTTSPLTATQLRGRLRLLRAPQQRRFRLALLLALVQALLLLVQYAALAGLLGQWLLFAVNGGPVPELDVLLLAALVVPLFVRPVLQYWREGLCRKASLEIRHGLRCRLLAVLGQTPTGMLHAEGEGAVVSQLLDQVDALDAWLQRYVVQAQLAVWVPVLLLVAIFPVSPLAGALMLLTAPLVPMFMIILGHMAANSSRRQLQALSRLSGRFLDLVRGMRSLQRLQATQQAAEQVRRASESYRERTMGVLRLAFLSSAVLEFFAALAIALVAVYLGLGLLGILPWAKGEVPVPYTGALFVLLLAPEFYAPLRQLGNDYHAKADAEAALQELQPVLDAGQQGLQGRQTLSACTAPAIAMREVRVVSGAGRLRLQLESLEIASGSSVLVQGVSGAGKSTLLQLLLGAMPWQGRISINGVNLADLQQAAWLNQLDYLAQQPRFMQGTLAQNLRLAQPQATDVELCQVLMQVGLAEVLADRGLELELNERGGGLSGGQLSRLALACLLLRDRPLWLLDEPTAHLDPDSRQQIHQLLRSLAAGRTLLLVSHADEGLDWVTQRLSLVLASAEVADEQTE